MEQITVDAFIDELSKIAVAGQVVKAPTAPKTSAATPAPSARLAPTPSVKPPTLGTPAAKSPIPNAPKIRNPGLQAQVSNMRRYTDVKTPSPPRRSGSIRPAQPHAPSVKGVATLPTRPAAPSFMRGQMQPQTRQSLGMSAPFTGI